MEKPLTSRERVRLALAHQQTDRVPIAMVCAGINPPAKRALETYLQAERGLSVDEYLRPLIDIQQIDPDYIGPSLATDTDVWGVRRKAISYGSGSYDEIDFYPLATATSIDDLERHPFPQAGIYDYAGFPEVIAAAQIEGDRCLMVANGNIFETSWYMRGLEQMFMDMVLFPEFARSLLEKVTDFYVEHFTRMLEAADGAVDLAFTADDIGGQRGLLMSLDMWETFIKPCHVRLNAAIHQFGVKVIYHTDGSVMDAVDGLIDMGIDVLQALQFNAEGMDPVALKRDFGDRLCFEGGICVQSTLPFGTPEEVRQEVCERKRVLGKGGGYILGPSHWIQAGTPPENIVAMFDAAAGMRGTKMVNGELSMLNCE